MGRGGVLQGKIVDMDGGMNSPSLSWPVGLRHAEHEFSVIHSCGILRVRIEPLTNTIAESARPVACDLHPAPRASSRLAALRRQANDHSIAQHSPTRPARQLASSAAGPLCTRHRWRHRRMATTMTCLMLKIPHRSPQLPDLPPTNIARQRSVA